MRNQIEFKVFGRYALFTDPVTKVGGEKFTYQIPTYQALKGICESIYWKPTIQWKVDEYRIMNPIRTQSQGVRPINYHGGNTLGFYTYLVDVEYEVKAHFEWNMNRPDLEGDRNEHKHYQVAMRMLEKGGRRDIFLGTRDCQGYVEPVKFGESIGFYDEYGELQFDNMFYCFDYPSDTGREELVAYFYRPLMQNGIIHFPASTESMKSKWIKEMKFEKVETIGLKEFESIKNLEEV